MGNPAQILLRYPLGWWGERRWKGSILEVKDIATPLDTLLPRSIAKKAEQVGVEKAKLDRVTLFMLAVLAGAFIALGAVFSTTVTAGTNDLWPYGMVRLVAGLVFCLGLILVVVAGAELFTGNCLIVMAWASRKISLALLLRNWGVVYLGNLVGALGTAALVFVSGHHTFGGGAVGRVALDIAAAKMQHGFVQATALGILCNTLVCLAVWLVLSARSTTDKILAVLFPITAFVACGFEHSIANMYFIPMGLFIESAGTEAFWESIGRTADQYGGLTWPGFLVHNLLPVTLGNIVGGALLVGGVYWLIYLRPHPGEGS